MRSYIADSGKYHQKSLRTKDKASAVEKATYEHARLLVLKAEGKAIFSPTVYKAVEQYLQHRYDYDVQMGSITDGRWSTIRTNMNWFKRFVNAELEVTPTAEQTAKYSVAQSKVDVESLRSCLMADDLKQQGLEVLEIGLQVKWVSTAEAKDLIEDGRSRGREYDVAELESHSAKAAKEYWKVHDKVVNRLEKKAQKENALFDRATENDKHGRKGGLATIGRQRIDYMSDEHIREAMLKEGYVKTFEQRTRRKQSIRTNTHKLLNKAQANIEAVEKGTFGVGH